MLVNVTLVRQRTRKTTPHIYRTEEPRKACDNLGPSLPMLMVTFAGAYLLGRKGRRIHQATSKRRSIDCACSTRSLRALMAVGASTPLYMSLLLPYIHAQLSAQLARVRSTCRMIHRAQPGYLCRARGFAYYRTGCIPSAHLDIQLLGVYHTELALLA